MYMYISGILKLSQKINTLSYQKRCQMQRPGPQFVVTDFQKETQFSQLNTFKGLTFFLERGGVKTLKSCKLNDKGQFKSHHCLYRNNNVVIDVQ